MWNRVAKWNHACVILVHDDPRTLCRFAAAVEHAGFAALPAADPMIALDMLYSKRPTVLLTRVDFGPGRLNGLALARMARFRYPTLPVLFACYRDWSELVDGLGPVLQMPIASASLAEALIAQVVPASPDRTAAESMPASVGESGNSSTNRSEFGGVSVRAS